MRVSGDKLRIGELFDMTKSDGMMLCNFTVEPRDGRATVSELAEKLHTQNPRCVKDS